MKKTAAAAALLAATMSPAWAQDLGTDKKSMRAEKTMAIEETAAMEEFVITANRAKTPLKEVGSSVTIIKAEDIERKQAHTVYEALKGVPGLDVVNAGGPGRVTSVFIRGARSEHTLVLIDGIKAADPSGVSGAFDFGHMGVENIERIEVIRGPQSVLYGSDAIGGVINIITKKGRGKHKTMLTAEAGSRGTFRETGSASGGGKTWNYTFGVSRYNTQGLSAASEKAGNTEKDAYENTTVSARLGLSFLDEALTTSAMVNYSSSQGELDNGAGKGKDDPNFTADTEQLLVGANAVLSLFEGAFSQSVGMSYTANDRFYDNPIDPDHPKDMSRSSYYGNRVKLDTQSRIKLHPAHTLTLGIETENEMARSEYYSESKWGPFSTEFKGQSARTTGLYVSDEIRLGDALTATAGIRSDEHTRFGRHDTYRFGSSYRMKALATTLRGTFGTGFKAPSLFQLHSNFGNLALKPETSKGWDVGIEKDFLNGRATAGITHFDNSFSEMVDFDPVANKYANIGRAETEGWEFSATLRPSKNLTIATSYTLTETKDLATGLQLLRRPKTKMSADAAWNVTRSASVSLGVLDIGNRDFNDFATFPAVRTEVSGYTLVNLAGSYKVNDSFTVFGRVDNLFDADYEEILGMSSPGLSTAVGLRYSFLTRGKKAKPSLFSMNK